MSKATMVVGTQVRLRDVNVVRDSVGLLGRVVASVTEFEKQALCDNPHFNLVCMSGDGKRVLMEDRQLEVVEEWTIRMLDRKGKLLFLRDTWLENGRHVFTEFENEIQWFARPEPAADEIAGHADLVVVSRQEVAQLVLARSLSYAADGF